MDCLTVEPSLPSAHNHKSLAAGEQSSNLLEILTAVRTVGHVRNGLGARGTPRGNYQEDWTGPDHNFYSVPSWDILVKQG